MWCYLYNSVAKSAFFNLRMIAQIKYFLYFKDHAFISMILSYCNALYLGITRSCLSRFQMVQNAAARLLTGTKKKETIPPVLLVCIASFRVLKSV